MTITCTPFGGADINANNGNLNPGSLASAAGDRIVVCYIWFDATAAVTQAAGTVTSTPAKTFVHDDEFVSGPNVGIAFYSWVSDGTTLTQIAVAPSGGGHVINNVCGGTVKVVSTVGTVTYAGATKGTNNDATSPLTFAAGGALARASAAFYGIGIDNGVLGTFGASSGYSVAHENGDGSSTLTNSFAYKANETGTPSLSVTYSAAITTSDQLFVSYVEPAGGAPVLALERMGAALTGFAGAGAKLLGLQAGTPPPIFNSWSRTNVAAAGPGILPAGAPNELGLVPGVQESVPVPLVARALAVSAMPAVGALELGLSPGLVESVPLALDRLGAARDPAQGPGGGIELGIVIAAPPPSAVLGWPARGAAPVLFTGQGVLGPGLQPGTAPVTVIFVEPVAGAAIPPGSGQGSLALGLNPVLALLVPPALILSGTAPQGAPPAGAIELGLVPGLAETVPLALIARAIAGPGPAPAGVLELGLVPGLVESVPLALIARSASRPGTVASGFRIVGFVVASVVVPSIPPMTVTWWSNGTVTAVAAGTVTWMDDGTLVVVDLGTAWWTSEGSL